MSRIRRLHFFDRKRVRDMVSFLDNVTDNTYFENHMFSPVTPLHYFLPLSLKFLPEAYVLKEDKELKGLISVAPAKCPLKQMEIEKLLFEENNYRIASELIQYVVSRYKAMGTASFIARVDDYLPELIKLFISKCGFSQISYEKLWKINRIKRVKYNPKSFRTFRNSDSHAAAGLYNDFLLPHFRPLVGKEPAEFRDVLLKGLYFLNEYKYVMEDRQTKTVQAVICIQTADNENYLIDVIPSAWCDIDINEIICFARDRIRQRKKRAKIFIKTKRYTVLGEKFEKEFFASGYECVKNQVVLTNSSAKIIQSDEKVKKYTVLNRFYAGISVTNP